MTAAGLTASRLLAFLLPEGQPAASRRKALLAAVAAGSAPLLGGGEAYAAAYTYIYIYIYVYVYIYIYTHICVYVYIYIYNLGQAVGWLGLAPTYPPHRGSGSACSRRRPAAATAYDLVYDIIQYNII